MQIIPPHEVTDQNKERDFVEFDSQESYVQMNFATLLKNITEAETASAADVDIEVTPANIKRVRLSQKKTLTEAAKELGISHTTLSRFENGKILSPTQGNLERMKIWISQNT